MFGFLHKIVLKQCHPLLCQAFPFAEGLLANYHSKALHPFSEEVSYQSRLFERSVYAYVLMYNRLPEALINLPTVSAFQKMLTHLAKEKARLDQEDWRRSFQDLMALDRMFYRS